MYTRENIALAFAISSGMFFGLSIFGRTTKRDLSGVGKLALAALIGLIIALFANFFLNSTPLMYGISILGVIIFSAFIAWDNQRIIKTYNQMNGNTTNGMAISLAFSLYLDFINLFMFVLSLVGGGSRK
jgi:FtsH-binding integral membrane protein